LVKEWLISARRRSVVAEKLESGIMALTTGAISMEMAPFGGVKQSGIGREDGRAGIEEYLSVKTFPLVGLPSMTGRP
jgi:succinate-semialdehyde dehydrogenase/glutarate-semialdehyde dehydrogenase